MHCQILLLKRCKTLFICISSLAQMLLYRYCIGVWQQWMALCTSLLDPKLLVHCRIFFSLNLGGWQWLWNLTNTHTQSHTQRLSREAVGASRREMSAQCQGVSLARHGRACLWMFLNVTTLEASGANTHTLRSQTERRANREKREICIAPRQRSRQGKMTDNKTYLTPFIRSYLNATQWLLKTMQQLGSFECAWADVTSATEVVETRDVNLSVVWTSDNQYGIKWMGSLCIGLETAS